MPSLRSDLHDPASYAHPTREADVIMKGGITSGVVYPLAACRVATDHRLRQLGGSSAGAIAAAIAAAAEHGRRVAPDSRDAGFPALATLPDFLGKNLLGLFQPQPETADAFHVLMAAVAPGGSMGSKVRAAVRAVQKTEPTRFWVPVGVAAVMLALLAWLASSDGGGWSVLAAVVLALLLLAVVAVLAWLWAAFGLVRRTMSAMDAQGFGLVNGHDPTGHTEPLTDWMTRMINETAGLPGGGRPLTMSDLWGPEATTVYRDLRGRDDVSPAEWSTFDPLVTLTTTTSCLNQGRPYQFPFTTDIFHYCPDCLRAYFPASVMEHLRATSRDASVVDDGAGPISMACPRHPHVQVRKLPAAPDLPVVMAARLSLSFPVLICAVPLHYVDFARARGKRSLVVGWFSDGGITTNFPMQFFDKLLPSRPTFGINLETAHPDFPDSEVFRMPQAGERLARSVPVTSVIGLLAGVKRTMHGWVDAMQMEVPGFRDRIVEVSMQTGEGGMNLAMPPEVIKRLSGRGDLAGQDLLEFDFETHRWIRFRTAMASLSEVLEHVHEKVNEAGATGLADREIPGSVGTATNAADAGTAADAGYLETLPQPWRGSYKFDSAEREQTVREQLAQLQQVGAEWRAAGYPATGRGAPRPMPQLRHVLRR